MVLNSRKSAILEIKNKCDYELRIKLLPAIYDDIVIEFLEDRTFLAVYALKADLVRRFL